MPRVLSVVVMIPALLLVFACGDGPEDPVPTPTTDAGATSGQPIGLPVLGELPQNLEVTGVLEGQLTYANVNCVHIRGATPEKGRFQMSLEGSIGGFKHRLRFIVNGYTGPGSYSWDGLSGSGPEVTVDLDGTYSGHATITVDAPGGSGQVDGFFTKNGDGRIYGFFECPGIPR